MFQLQPSVFETLGSPWKICYLEDILTVFTLNLSVVVIHYKKQGKMSSGIKNKRCRATSISSHQFTKLKTIFSIREVQFGFRGEQ